MDTLILLGSFFVLMMIGVPIAYSLGLAALAGALWIDLPFDAVMIQVASGVNKFSLLAIPFFVLAGAIMAEGGMARRLVELRVEHRDLDTVIERLAADIQADELALKRLKRRKLQLKDQIAWIENALIPDEPA